MNPLARRDRAIAARMVAAPSGRCCGVVALAEAMYQGDNCSGPLHAALLEASHPELAEHFRQEEWHPKGCWVIDLLTGRNVGQKCFDPTFQPGEHLSLP